MPKGWVGSGSDNARGRPGLNLVYVYICTVNMLQTELVRLILESRQRVFPFSIAVIIEGAVSSQLMKRIYTKYTVQ